MHDRLIGMRMHRTRYVSSFFGPLSLKPHYPTAERGIHETIAAIMIIGRPCQAVDTTGGPPHPLYPESQEANIGRCIGRVPSARSTSCCNWEAYHVWHPVGAPSVLLAPCHKSDYSTSNVRELIPASSMSDAFLRCGTMTLDVLTLPSALSAGCAIVTSPESCTRTMPLPPLMLWMETTFLAVFVAFPDELFNRFTYFWSVGCI